MEPVCDKLQSDEIEIISKALGVSQSEIKFIRMLKRGMTNRSFLFEAGSEEYIIRIPGEGTQILINRYEEADVFELIRDKNICEEIVYMNPENGYKITKFIHGAKNCDPHSLEETVKCMEKLRKFHEMKLQVKHTFDIFSHIIFYENLWNGAKSVYGDYETTKKNVFRLKGFIDTHKSDYVLTHIDAVHDNFLFVRDNGEEKLYLIDWEYAAMQDPHVDIAMFCIYAMYGHDDVDRMIDAYFNGKCDAETKTKIYCYIAACGLLWSNWCEYKRQLGIEFGEYALRQYCYAKDYYRLAVKEMKDDEKCPK